MLSSFFSKQTLSFEPRAARGQLHGMELVALELIDLGKRMGFGAACLAMVWELPAILQSTGGLGRVRGACRQLRYVETSMRAVALVLATVL